MRILLIIFSLLGFADSTFLVWDSLSATEYCGMFLAKLGIASCTTVTESAYSVLWGYPISIFGMIVYSSVGILTFKGRHDENYRKGIFLVASGGFLGSLFLTYVQWRILENWCFFCLISAGLMTAIFLVSLAFLGSVSPQIKKRRHDLRRSFKTVALIALVTLILFEAFRGRLFYNERSSFAETPQMSIPGQDVWVGIIDKEFVTLYEINALAGAVEPEYRSTAFDYLLLAHETELNDLTLAEMITEQTGLRLFPPQPVEIPAEIPVEDSVVTGETGDEVVSELEGVTEADKGEEGTYEEQKFRAYLGFLERAEQKDKLALWESYLAQLKVKYQVQITFP